MRAVIGGSDAVVFETRREAAEWVGVALGSEVGPDDYDVDAITDEVFAWDTATDADGTVHLNRQCFRLAATTEEFWESVARHDAAIGSGS